MVPSTDFDSFVNQKKFEKKQPNPKVIPSMFWPKSPFAGFEILPET